MLGIISKNGTFIMSKSPSFQLYVRDILSSNLVAVMDGDEFKVYMFLLCASWLENERATLPIEDKDLAMLARITDRKWLKVRDKVLRGFKLTEKKDRYYNERLVEVSDLQYLRSKIGSKGGTKTASKRVATLKAKDESKLNLASSSALSVSKEHLIVSFDMFWDAYNKKNGKKETFTKWKGMSEKDRVAAFAGVKNYVANNLDPQYRKDPVRYLRNRIWEDEANASTEFELYHYECPKCKRKVTDPTPNLFEYCNECSNDEVRFKLERI